MAARTVPAPKANIRQSRRLNLHPPSQPPTTAAEEPSAFPPSLAFCPFSSVPAPLSPFLFLSSFFRFLSFVPFPPGPDGGPGTGGAGGGTTRGGPSGKGRDAG